MNFSLDNIDDFLAEQLRLWPQAAERFKALAACKSRTVELPGNATWEVTFNPSRIVSSAAKVDAASIAKRPCFLCQANRPEEQILIPWLNYSVLVNPFPIFSRHLTIVANDHTPQLIGGRAADMARLALQLPDFTLFYNGPRCGASAPDHFHFQAVGRESLPVKASYPFATLRFVCSGDDAEGMLAGAMAKLPVSTPGEETPVNILCHKVDDSNVEFVIIPRRRHRPTNFGPGDGEILVSPASVDLGGVMVAPREQEWEKIDAPTLLRLFSELCYDPSELAEAGGGVPRLKVGILTAEEVTISLDRGFSRLGELTLKVIDGEVVDSATGAKIDRLDPVNSDSRFTVRNVMIGIDFHWQQHIDQSFEGAVRFVADGDKVVVINEIDVEKYLESVISSEMSATSSEQLLRAHSVISRSWVMAQIAQRNAPHEGEDCNCGMTTVNTPERYIAYTDREAHGLFDVCADDHCQRYQGVTRITTEAARRAVADTRGQVLIDSAGVLCDTRFSKCCGGVMEQFSTCWQNRDYSYLSPLRDNPVGGRYPADLTHEANARSFIINPQSGDYCNCNDPEILSQVLNNFDRSTTDFYRWEQRYSVEELSELVARRSGFDFGTILELNPIKRGPSGRIYELEIVGTNLRMIVGKELTIRRWLSESHLRSSAFVVDRDGDNFIIRGAGWGHGVGLCQIGAAVMGARGICYREILTHYYPGSKLSKAYN